MYFPPRPGTPKLRSFAPSSPHFVSRSLRPPHQTHPPTTAFPCLRDPLAASPEMYLPKSASVEGEKKRKRDSSFFGYPSENRAGQYDTISCLLPSLNCVSKGGLRAPSSCVSSALPAYLSSLESYSPKTSAQMVGSALCSLHSLSSS